MFLDVGWINNKTDKNFNPRSTLRVEQVKNYGSSEHIGIHENL